MIDTSWLTGKNAGCTFSSCCPFLIAVRNRNTSSSSTSWVSASASVFIICSSGMSCAYVRISQATTIGWIVYGIPFRRMIFLVESKWSAKAMLIILSGGNWQFFGNLKFVIRICARVWTWDFQSQLGSAASVSKKGVICSSQGSSCCVTCSSSALTDVSRQVYLSTSAKWNDMQRSLPENSLLNSSN